MSGRAEGSRERELVFCHQCQNEWHRDQHGLQCPQCESEFVEVVSAFPLQKRPKPCYGKLQPQLLYPIYIFASSY